MATMVADLFANLGLRIDRNAFAQGTALIRSLQKALSPIEIGKDIVGIVEKVTDLGDHFYNLSKQVGISAESLQKLAFGAAESGVSADKLTNDLGKLEKGLVSAAQKGKGPAADAFRALGLSQAQLQFSSKNLEGGLGLIADKFQKLPDGPQKSAIAMQLFGRSGKDLNDFLSKGSAGIQELSDKAVELGVVMSDVAIKDLHDFHNSLGETKKTFEGLEQQLVIELLPTINDLLKSFRDWLSTNKELVANALASVVDGLTIAFKALGTVMSVAADVIQLFVEDADKGQAVVIALGVVIAAFAINAAVAWAIALAPILLIIAAIAAVAVAVRYLINNWRDVGTEFNRITNRIGEAFQDAFTWINDTADSFKVKLFEVGTKVRNFFVNDIPEAIKKAWDELGEFISKKVQEVVETVKNNKVVSFLMKVGNATSGGPLVSDEDVANAMKEAQAQGAAPAAEPSAEPARPGSEPQASAGPVTIQGGDVAITINGVTDPVAVGDLVQKGLEEHMSSLLLHAQEVVG